MQFFPFNPSPSAQKTTFGFFSSQSKHFLAPSVSVIPVFGLYTAIFVKMKAISSKPSFAKSGITVYSFM